MERIHVREFLASLENPLSNIRVAGFLAILEGKAWRTKEQWQELYDKFIEKEV